VGNLVITMGHQKQEEEVEKTGQIKKRAVKRREEKFCLAGFCAEKEQNKMKDLLYFRYHLYTYVITAHILGTKCTPKLLQLVFQV
jgi:hypothetical protein